MSRRFGSGRKPPLPADDPCGQNSTLLHDVGMIVTPVNGYFQL
jgi:hypothetical protein